MKTTTLPLRNLMNRSPLRLAFLLIPLVLGCFGLSPQARAVCQEGCLANVNTVLGDDALVNASGASNTAIGADALGANTTGSNNTADGSGALGSNRTGSTNIALGNNAGFNLTTGSNNIDI